MASRDGIFRDETTIIVVVVVIVDHRRRKLGAEGGTRARPYGSFPQFRGVRPGTRCRCRRATEIDDPLNYRRRVVI